MENQPIVEEGLSSQDFNLKKQFTTVTPLSKYLALVLFTLLPFVGFYLGRISVMPQNYDSSNISFESIPVVNPEKIEESNYIVCGNGDTCLIPEINLELVTSGLGNLLYTVNRNPTNESSSVLFSTEELIPFGGTLEYCQPKHGPLGRVIKINKELLVESYEKENQSSEMVHWMSNPLELKRLSLEDNSGVFEFGDYFILYVGPQASCADSEEGSELQNDLVQTIKAAFIYSQKSTIDEVGEFLPDTEVLNKTWEAIRKLTTYPEDCLVISPEDFGYYRHITVEKQFGPNCPGDPTSTPSTPLIRIDLRTGAAESLDLAGGWYRL